MQILHDSVIFFRGNDLNNIDKCCSIFAQCSLFYRVLRPHIFHFFVCIKWWSQLKSEQENVKFIFQYTMLSESIELSSSAPTKAYFGK